MSLINNMLKDLEKRENNNPIAYISVKKNAQHSSNTIIKLFTQPLLWLAIILAMFSTIFIFSIIPTKHALTIAPIIDEQINSDSFLPGNKELEEVTPTIIKDISLEVQGNITEIKFILEQPTPYRLEGSENHLIINIGNADLQSTFPQIENLNTAIQRISSNNENGNIKIDLTLLPDATVKSVNLINQQDQSAELVVRIEYSPPTTSDAAIPIDNIKKPAIQTLLAEQYRSAIAHAGQGQYEIAIDRLSSILKVDPSYKDARVSLVALLLDQGESVRAKEIIDDGLNLTPDFPLFIELKARLLNNEGKTKDALNLLQTVIPPITENPDYHAFMAALYQQNNDNLLASKIYKQLLVINPENGSWWFGLGISLEKMGQTTVAVDAYTKAIAMGHLTADSISYVQKRLQILQEKKHEKS